MPLPSVGQLNWGEQLNTELQGRTASRRPNKVALLGASLTANNGNSTLVANPGAGNPSGWMDLGIFTWANQFLGCPMDVVVNVSQGGLTSSGIYGHVGTVTAASPDFVIGHDWWINDIVNGVPTATSKTNIGAIISACNAAGATVLLTDYLAVSAYSTAAQVAQHHDMLAWLRTQQGAGFALVPVADQIVDIATGLPLSWAVYDGTHPSPRGARAMGLALARRLAGLFSEGAPHPVAANYAAGIAGGSPYELMGNPMISGTPVGGVAPNFTITGTGTAGGSKSVVAATDIPGLNWQRATFGADGFINITPALVTGAGLSYTGPSGTVTITSGTTRVRMQLEYRVPAASAAGKWVCPTARWYTTGATASIYAVQDTNAAGQDTGLTPSDTDIYVAQSPTVVVPVGTTALNSVITVYGQVGAILDVRRVSVAIVP